METELLYKEETSEILSACVEVHNILGCGFLEPVYQAALAREFKLRNIPFEKEKKIEVFYKGEKIDRDYFADFLCYGKIIVELKAIAKLVNANKSQVINYLNATNLKVGLLINFGEASLKWERISNFK